MESILFRLEPKDARWWRSDWCDADAWLIIKVLIEMYSKYSSAKWIALCVELRSFKRSCMSVSSFILNRINQSIILKWSSWFQQIVTLSLCLYSFLMLNGNIQRIQIIVYIHFWIREVLPFVSTINNSPSWLHLWLYNKNDLKLNLLLYSYYQDRMCTTYEDQDMYYIFK